MILRGNHKPFHSEMKSYAMEKSIRKEIDHVWALLLTIESLHNIKTQGPNEKGEHYIKI